MKSDAVVCLSLANLCLTHARFEVLFTADHDFYNTAPFSLMPVAALAINFAALALLFYAGGRLVRHVRTRWLLWTARVTAVLLLLVPVNFVRSTYPGADRIAEVLGRPVVLGVVIIVILAVAIWDRPAWRVARFVLLIMSPLIVFTAAHGGRLLFDIVNAPPVVPSAAPAMAPPSPGAPRVVWVVLDELEQRTAFEERPAGVALPELDRFRSAALSAVNAWPPAGKTEMSMPALLTGRRVVEARSISADDLALVFADGSKGGWSAQQNVFDRARALGRNTALVGWYLPYSRSLGKSVHAIHWVPSVAYEQARGPSWSTTLVNQLGTLAPMLNIRRLHRDRYLEYRDHALRAAIDPRFGLVLLHAPVPHAPAIYRRDSGSLTMWNVARERWYPDNLALADRFVGDVRREMERSGAWDRTWVLITSDHWFRGSKHRDGATDPRVPFLLKAAGGSRPLVASTAFDTIVTGDLLLAILRGEVSNTDAAGRWLDMHRVAPPVGYTAGRPRY